MKTSTFLLSLPFTLFCFTAKAQTTIQTPQLTSYGVSAGTYGEGTFYGYQAGKNSNADSSGNTYIGSNSGRSTTYAIGNSCLGFSSGEAITSGDRNVFIGGNAGSANTTGRLNAYLGYASGSANEKGENNVGVGAYAGLINYNSSGASDNTHIGAYAGFQSKGSKNVFIGRSAGEGSSVNAQLFIANSNTSTPLIWGSFDNQEVKLNGKVGVSMGANAFPTNAGSVNVQNYKLFVNGGILATEVRVATTWADYVFEKNYNLLPLNEVESYIKENGHLPNVPSATQVEKDGIEVGEISKIQQEKIEELTLYTIAQQKEIEAQKELLKQQQKQIDELKKLVNQLIEK